MHSPLKLLTYDADGAIPKYRILKFGGSDNTVTCATGNADLIFAVSEHVGAADGGRIDCVVAGPANVEYGDNVTRGQKLTSDGQGRAVPAVGDPDDVIHYAGVALVSGALGDIGSVNVAPGMFIVPTPAS